MSARPKGEWWAIPQPLVDRAAPEPYPLDALPATLAGAVIEVQEFAQAPMPMVAASALSSVSLAVQSYVDVQRAERLHGPVGLYSLVIADSGERKSTVDGFFVQPIQQYQDEQAERYKPILIDYKADMDAWSAKNAGIKEKIRAQAKAGKSTRDHEDELRMLEQNKPEPPRIPRLLLGDETPEQLAYRLAHNWPASGVMSSEAGLIFGAHGMGKDSVMRSLGLLNILWDGGSHSVGRRTSESFEVRGARLTVGLQVQEATLLEFFDRAGALARGTGFLARFLVSWPESTQGSRQFREAPASWPRLAILHRRIAALLEIEPPLTEEGTLAPQLLTLSPEARREWVSFYNSIEVELRPGGDLYDVRDVASKIADNAARIAALFHVLEHGPGAISKDALTNACRVAAWHLNESRRFFGELALPPEMLDASKLDRWLQDEARAVSSVKVNKNHARRFGPIRDGKRLTQAIEELVNLDRLQVDTVGRRIDLVLNPELIKVRS